MNAALQHHIAYTECINYTPSEPMLNTVRHFLGACISISQVMLRAEQLRCESYFEVGAECSLRPLGEQ
jgi:hypothetical protein